MEAKKLFKQLAYIIIFIFMANFLANKLHWYYSIWWFDIVMHFFGGFWLGLVFAWVILKKDMSLAITPRVLLRVGLWVLIVGLSWEFFEFYFINHLAQNPFDLVDTISDLFCDISGGYVAFLYISKKYD
jgi:hypothetical protein